MTQHALAEPALFYVRLLFASDDLIRLGALPRATAHWLQAQSLRAIHAALSDPARATADPMILAIGRIAMHEALYGDGDRARAAALHRHAQARMVALRGGLAALPFPAIVKRLMRWADGVMAVQTGSAPLLVPHDAGGAGGAVDAVGAAGAPGTPPLPPDFSPRQSFSVLRTWAPLAAPDYCRRIPISHLLAPSDPPPSRLAT